jgi:DNA-binding MarR family transcriptional regulator
MNTNPDRDEALTLEILDAVHRNESISQRSMARSMGVALGLANSYLRRCVRKGLIKVTQAPANRYFYYLTPKGFTEKSRLTARYLSYSFSFYRKASEACQRAIDICERQGWQRLLMCGVSDLAEIATLRAWQHNMPVIGYLDFSSVRLEFLNRPVWRQMSEVDAFDACILTDLMSPQASYDVLQGQVAPDRILVPGVLSLERIII